MITRLCTGLIASLLAAGGGPALGQEANRDGVPDTPGTGAHPAIKEIDPGLPGQVIYRGLIDSEAIAVSGFSCGGAQALMVAADPRVRTAVIMNSGLFVDGQPEGV